MGAGLLALLPLLMACSLFDSTGPEDYEEVRVAADAQEDRVVVQTIRNGSAVPITHVESCFEELYGREGKVELPDFYGCIVSELSAVEIAPGDEQLSPRTIPDWVEPGEYRYEVELRGPDGELLPDAARISNWFEVE